MCKCGFILDRYKVLLIELLYGLEFIWDFLELFLVDIIVWFIDVFLFWVEYCGLIGIVDVWVV